MIFAEQIQNLEIMIKNWEILKSGKTVYYKDLSFAPDCGLCYNCGLDEIPDYIFYHIIKTWSEVEVINLGHFIQSKVSFNKAAKDKKLYQNPKRLHFAVHALLKLRYLSGVLNYDMEVELHDDFINDDYESQ